MIFLVKYDCVTLAKLLCIEIVNQIFRWALRPKHCNRHYLKIHLFVSLHSSILCIGWSLCVLYHTLDGIRFGIKTLRIYISAHFVSTSFKVLIQCLLTAWLRKWRRSKTKIKGVSKKFEFRREDLNA